VLNLSNNNISKLEGLGDLDSLQVFDLSSNNISKLEGLSSLDSLQVLNLSNNNITKLEGFDSLDNLQELRLSGNQISKLEGLGSLSNLQGLNLSGNQISKLDGLDSLGNLQELYLSGNQISKLGKGLEHLNALTALYLSNNYLRVAEDIYELEILMPSLDILKISGNPVWLHFGMILEDDYTANHLETIKSFFNDLPNFQAVDLPCKVVLLGNHAAGKSSLLSCLLGEKIDLKHESTHGLKVKVPPSSQPEINYGLPDTVYYDFGGQDFYHGIYRLFIKQQALKILLVDPANNSNRLRHENCNTVANIQYTQDFNLKYWAAQINYMQDKHVLSDHATSVDKDILLVQSHHNENSTLKWQLANDAGNERVYRFFGLNLHQDVVNAQESIALEKKETIASIELAHFKSTFNLIALARRQQVLLTPQRIQLTRDVLELIRQDRQEDAKPVKVITFKNQKFGRKYSVEWFKLQLEQLNAAGLVLYDQKVAAGEYVWLNPKALVDYVHQYILSPELIRSGNQQGIINQVDFNKKRINAKTLELMEYYRIIFRHQPDESNEQQVEYIIPNYLPLVGSNDTLVALSTFGLNKPSFILRFLRFIPVGMINHLVCFFGRQPDKKLFWRDMMVFTLSKGPSSRYRIHIKLDFSQLEIQVCVDGEERDYTSVCKYLFYCLMRFYWDVHAKDESALEYTEFYKLTAKHGTYSNKDELADMEQQDDELSFDEDKKFWQDFYGKNGGVAGVANDDYVPDDLYVSLNGESFVKYSQLLNHDEKEPLIKAYSLQVKEESDDVEPIALPQGVAVQDFAIFTQRTFTSVKKIFISYSRMDVSYKNELSLVLKTSLESGGHEVWDCGELELGKWDTQIQSKLKEADLVICMLSIHFFASNYILHKELINTLQRLEQDSTQQIMCVVVKAFPWDSFSRLGKQVALSEQRLADLKQQLNAELSPDAAKAAITEYQFLPYRYHAQSSIRGEHVQRITPLASLSDADRDEVYVEIEGRVRKALGI
jgi:internalin A